jgi:hypothetical protein
MSPKGSFKSRITCHRRRKYSGAGVNSRNGERHSKYNQAMDQSHDGDWIVSFHAWTSSFVAVPRFPFHLDYIASSPSGKASGPKLGNCKFDKYDVEQVNGA